MTHVCRDPSPVSFMSNPPGPVPVSVTRSQAPRHMPHCPTLCSPFPQPRQTPYSRPVLAAVLGSCPLFLTIVQPPNLRFYLLVRPAAAPETRLSSSALAFQEQSSDSGPRQPNWLALSPGRTEAESSGPAAAGFPGGDAIWGPRERARPAAARARGRCRLRREG